MDGYKRTRPNFWLGYVKHKERNFDKWHRSNLCVISHHEVHGNNRNKLNGFQRDLYPSLWFSCHVIKVFPRDQRARDPSSVTQEGVSEIEYGLV